MTGWKVNYLISIKFGILIHLFGPKRDER